MSYVNDHSFCRKVREWIDDSLEGALDTAERGLFEQHVAQCPACREEFELAKKIERSFSEFPELHCPDTVKAGVFARIENEKSPHRVWEAIKYAFKNLLLDRRPAVATLVLASLLALFMLLSKDMPAPVRPPSPEVARAELEVKWTLAYFSTLGRKSGSFVQDDVIAGQVLAPLMKELNESLISTTKDTR